MVHFWSRNQDPESLIIRLEDEVRRLENKFSRYKATSLLSKINRGEYNRKPLDQETAALLNYAQQCFELSDGLFDITVGSYRRVWDFKSNKLPSKAEISEVQARVGWLQTQWDGSSLLIENQMELDLGGIVKEFAVDRLVNILIEQDAIGLVNLAGDIAVTGLRIDGSPWPISIVHPRQINESIATVQLQGGAITSSGDYERFMMVDGHRYHHILNPKTGFPELEGFASVSVIAEKCLLAGSISTIAMLKGKYAKQWLDDMALPFLAVSSNLKLFGSIEV